MAQFSDEQRKILLDKVIDGIEIHGLKAFEWLKLIEMQPKDSAVLKLLKGYPFDSENAE